MSIRLMASVLTADLANLADECRRLESAGLDGIQWDIMDAVAVPSLSFGPDVITACRPHVGFAFEAHVMVHEPGPMLEPLRDAGCELVIVHPDLLAHPWRTAEHIRELGMRCGMALSPGIPVQQVQWLLEVCDQVLVMTVEPGYGGQRYLQPMEAKVAAVAELCEARGAAHEIEVDGGIAPETIAGAFRAGARTFVVGSALWRGESFEDVVGRLRRTCGGLTIAEGGETAETSPSLQR